MCFNTHKNTTLLTMSTFSIRPIQKEDNARVAQLIREVLVEHGVPKVGTAYEDAALDCMFETYKQERATYFVVVDNSQIIGGAGIAPLANYNGNVCELQKMYFLDQARGRGIGAQMINTCIKEAQNYNYDGCYLETMPYMNAAQKLYERVGFTYVDGPMGNTGHYSCPVHMYKILQQ